MVGMVTRRLATLGLALLILAASACGGDDAEELSPASAAAIEQIEAICADWHATLDRRGDFPVSNFDPENPAPDDLRTVGAYFAAGHPAGDAAIASIDGLTVPDEIEPRVEALVMALARQQEGSKAQARAAQAGDVEAFKATLDGVAPANDAIEDAANELGAESCIA
jgi:hypothetical protein